MPLGRLFRKAANAALPSTPAVMSLLIISKIMDHSGQITVLALGIAAITTGVVFLGLSSLIGLLGAFITSSNTSSNVLFAPLQATVARALDVPVELVLAAQSAGGATGNSISPSDVLMGATTAGVPNQLGDILKRAIPWALATCTLIGVTTVVLYILAY